MEILRGHVHEMMTGMSTRPEINTMTKTGYLCQVAELSKDILPVQGPMVIGMWTRP